MSRNYNKVILVGNVGATPELRHTKNNTSVTNFSISTIDHYKNKSGELQKLKKWHRIVCWGKLAENTVRGIKEGQLVLIEGALSYRNREKDGIKIPVAEIKASEVKKWANAIHITHENENVEIIEDDDIGEELTEEYPNQTESLS